MSSAHPKAPMGAPGKPLACTECGAGRHRLYYATRWLDEAMPGTPKRRTQESAWACRDCGHRGPWRLAIADVLVMDHEKTAGPEDLERPPACVPSQTESRQAIRTALDAAEDRSIRRTHG